MIAPLLLTILPISKTLALAIPVQDCPPYPNSTNSTNTTTTLPPGPTTLPTSAPVPIIPCPKQTLHASTLHTLNSLYPNHTIPSSAHFIALREPHDAFQLVTQVQFVGIDPSAQKCSLQLLLPKEQLMGTGGTNPVLEVWQVKAGEGGSDGVRWNDFVLAENTTAQVVDSKLPLGNGSANSTTSFHNLTQSRNWNATTTSHPTPAPTPTPLTIIPGNPDSLASIRANGGIVSIDDVTCNQTLTFQVGIQKPGIHESKVSYWDFVNVAPPAGPVQGWQMVVARTGC